MDTAKLTMLQVIGAKARNYLAATTTTIVAY